MKKLPTEIIIDITTHLSIADNLNLACTCKKFHEIILENTLYNKLFLKDRVKFDQAVIQCDKKNFGDQVRHLGIGNMTYDVDLVSALARLFPRVQFLKFENGPDHSSVAIEEMAENWKNVKSIVDASKIRDLVPRLLRLETNDHLRTLELNCAHEPIRDTINYRQERTQALIKAIHNAPLLQKLVIRYPILKIADVEQLHAKATKLAYLELCDVVIGVEDGVDTQVVYHSASDMISFGFKEIRSRTGELDDALNSWIYYIGIKYPQLRVLNLTLDPRWERWDRGDLIRDKETVTMTLANAITNMKHLKRYSVLHICSSQQLMFEAMNANKAQLEHLGLFVDKDTSIKEDFTCIQASSPVSTVLSLSFTCESEENPLVLINCLVDLCLTIHHLTHLKITNNKHIAFTPMMLINLLENLKALKSLEFDGLDINLILENLLLNNNQQVSNMHTKRLESLYISGIQAEDCQDLKRFDDLLTVTLQSCPALKRIKLSTFNICVSGVINLDFTRSPLLTHIELDMPNCQYYTFQHEPGKRWRTLNEEMPRDFDFTIAQDSTYVVNLAWDANKYIDLQLSQCSS